MQYNCFSFMWYLYIVLVQFVLWNRLIIRIIFIGCYCVPDSFLYISHVVSHSVLTETLCGRILMNTFCKWGNQSTERWRYLTKVVQVQPGFEPRSLHSRSYTLTHYADFLRNYRRCFLNASDAFSFVIILWVSNIKGNLYLYCFKIMQTQQFYFLLYFIVVIYLSFKKRKQKWLLPWPHHLSFIFFWRLPSLLIGS